MNTSIYIITGASGVGKTTLLNELKRKYSGYPWSFFHFDSVGVPSIDEMNKKFGSPAAWQQATTKRWIKQIMEDAQSEKYFLEGQMNLQFIKDAFAEYDFSDYKIILIDCNAEEMGKRITEKRKQPELLTDNMINWLSFLRNQAQKMNIPILDTSHKNKEQGVKNLESSILNF